MSAAAGHPSAYDLRTHAATPPRLPCPTAPAPMARGQPRHQSPARRHAMRMVRPPPIRLPRPVPAVAAALLPLRCAKIGPRSRGHLYITCSQWPTVAGSNVFFRGRTWGPGRARTRWPCRAIIVAHRIARPPHAVAAALVVDVWERGRNGLWSALRSCEGTAGTLARCLRSPAFGAGAIPPAPRHRTCGTGWLAHNLRPVYRYAVVMFPHALIMLPFLRPFRRSLSERIKARCQPVVIVSHRAAFRLVKCGGRCPQSLRVPRVLVCSSRQLYRQPAPRRPLPRRG